MTRGLEISVNERDGRRIYALVGEINLNTAPELHESILGALSSPNVKIVLDLSRVNYMDSSGVGTLVDIKRRVSKVAGDLVLLSPQKMVRSVLEITQLTRFFTITDKLDPAGPA